LKKIIVFAALFCTVFSVLAQTQIQLRRGTTAEWTAANPILAEGEVGIDLTTSCFRIGNGVSPWGVLPDFVCAGGNGGGGEGGATQLSELSDVNTSTPTAGNFLIADGVDWESRAATIADIGGTAIGQNDLAGRVVANDGPYTGLGLLDLTEEATPGAGDYCVGWESGGALRKFELPNLLSSCAGMANFLVEGDTARSVSIADGDTLRILGGTGITTDDSVPGTITINSTVTPGGELNDLSALTTGINLGQFIIGTGPDAAIYTTVAGLTEETSPENGDFVIGANAEGGVRRFTARGLVNRLDDVMAGVAQGQLVFGSATPGIGFYSKISGLTEKPNPVAGDWLLCEGAEGTVNKCDVGDLPAGAEANNLEALTTGIAINEILVGTGANTAAYQKLSALAEEASPAAGDWLLCENSAGVLGKCDVGDLPGAALAETNNLEAVTTGIAIGELVFGVGADTASYLKISALQEEGAPAAGDWILGETVEGAVRKYDVGNLPISLRGNASLDCSGATTTVSLVAAAAFSCSLTADTVLAVSNAPATPDVAQVTLYVTASGADRTVDLATGWYARGTQTWPVTIANGSMVEIQLSTTPTGEVVGSYVDMVVQ
jgi:hypothetical protein